MKKENLQKPVAIIGMGGMFAKSTTLKGFWRTLLNGIDCITEPPETHCQLNELYDADPKKPDHIYCNRGGFLPSVPFDPTEFGIPPAALEATDTSQLLGLVVAKTALADAGYDTDREFDRENTSVILGVTGTQELVVSLGSRLGHPLWKKALENKGLNDHQKKSIIEDISDSYVPWQENSFPGLLGNVVAGRISNRLNLGGTNCVVDAACASSMSAIHLALMELDTGKSNMVVTGGVDTLNDSFMHMCFSRTGVLSHSGDARPFSANSDGTVLGEGIGILVLKRLEDARQDGDRIYAVIRGIGSSSDGKSQSIYAPRADGQARALRKAYQRAGVSPETIDMIEAHGTGTRVGDEVEFTALKNVFGAEHANGNRCALGSVKSMIGHTKASAGAAGLIKSALSLYNKVLLPTLKADPPDPKLEIESSPFYLNRSPRPWFKQKNHPRRCGVSSFGFGGSNFHVVLEEDRKEKKEIAWDGTVEILAFSGKTNAELLKKLQAANQLLNADFSPETTNRSARQLRANFETSDSFRLVIVVENTIDERRFYKQVQSAIDIVSKGKSTELSAQGLYFSAGDRTPEKIAFLFPGQGSQYTNMGKDLACRFPGAMDAIEMIGGQFDNPITLWETIFPRPAFSKEQEKEQSRTLRKTDLAQPAIGAISMAMLSVLDYFNLRPDVTCGHSYGELPALCAAGWFDEETLSVLSVKRGQLMANAAKDNEAGTMLAVKASIESLESLVRSLPDVVLANINSPDQGVLSGSKRAIASAKAACTEKGYRTVDLPVAAAFHSTLVEGAAKPFANAVGDARITPTNIPVFANVTGLPYPADPPQAIDLLGRQLTSSVQFRQTVENLYETGVRTFVEVGPKAVLSGLVRSTLKSEKIAVISVDKSSGKQSGVLDLAHALAHLAALGADVDLNRWEKELPAVPTQKMTIPLSGINHRSTQKKKPERNPSEKAFPTPKPKKHPPLTTSGPETPKRHVNKIQNIPMNDTQSTKSFATIQNERTNALPTTGSDLNDALSIVQKGLESIQSIQQQTARAHQTFLETQAQASRTLQEMMASTRMLIGAKPDSPLRDEKSSMAPAPPLETIASSSTPMAAPDPVDAVPRLPVSETIRQEPIRLPETDLVKEAFPENKNILNVQKELISIVSELTGYPHEMLGMGMDIEADLGIDSIKRVEILSTMEERMPELPQVTPDMVGTLKTLGQICDFLTSGNHGSSTLEPATPETKIASDAIQNELVAIVSELTGYPEEMLGLDMDIESDLGIDSIKRVEILSAMEERMPHLPQVTPDMVGTLKTLGQIRDFLSKTGTGPSANITEAQISVPKRATPSMSEQVPRQIIDIVTAIKKSDRPFQIETGRWVGVLCENEPLALSIIAKLEKRQIPGRRIQSKTVDSPSTFSRTAGLIICNPTTPENAFLAAKNAAPELFEAARKKDALFGVVTTMDGAFGFSGKVFTDPGQGALPGLAKTAALEWESVLCRAIDISPERSDPDTIAGRVVEELLAVSDHDPVEIGLLPDRRVALQPIPAQTVGGPACLNDKDVVVITGGARGVTAACALELARSTGAAIALIGRSEQPFTIPEWLENLEDDAAVKKAIMDHVFTDHPPTPKILETEYCRQMANLSVTRTIDKIKALGVSVGYFSADVTVPETLDKAVQSIRGQFGPITGLIHGAGMLQDRLIVDKTIDQFRQVYQVKVGGLQNLLTAMETEPLRHLILFSSVSARTGNNGQCDYAMANEVLNKMARVESNRRSDCRATAINWGPWDGGMVTPSLKKVFADNQVALIPLEAGARLMVQEMQTIEPGPVEVLIGSMLTTQAESLAASAENPMALLERRELDLHRYPVLSSHVIGGKPVVPFALISEWIGHGALKENPGFSLHGIDDFRLLSGIRIDQGKKLVRLMAGKAEKSGDGWQVAVELRNGVKNGKDVIHSRAKALLVDRLPAAPVYSGNGKNGSRAYSRDLETIYGEILFHGDQLRAIRTIEEYSDHGMKARLTNAPEPEAWMQDPIKNRWMADPMVLDGAFQMAIVWCFEQNGAVCLPSYARSYRQYRTGFPASGVTAVMEVTASSAKKMVADFTFLDDDDDDNVVATLFGYEATVDKSLLHSFKDNVVNAVMEERVQ